MDCRNHAGVGAVNQCTGCAESFCGSCLVSVGGAAYCTICGSMAAGPPVFGYVGDVAEAEQALKLAVVGIFCIGPVLQPVALVKALQARRAIRSNPGLGGEGKALAALIVSGGYLLIMLLLIMTSIF